MEIQTVDVFGESIYYTKPLELMKIAVQRIRNNPHYEGEM